MSDDRNPLHLAEYEALAAVALTDADRWPAISPEAQRRLSAVLDGPLSPPWTHRTGHRLDRAAIDRLAEPRPTTDWIAEHLATARRLPAYRGHPGPLETLEQFPFLRRDDLVDDVAGFVPLDADLSRLVHGSSSGATGHALQIPDDIDDVARTFWLLVELVRGLGVDWQPHPERLALAYVLNQREAFTYASAVPGFGDTVMARMNLGLASWGSRDAFLAANDPQVITGSPVSLAVLLEPQLVATLHPLAIVSGATHLSAPLRADLEAAYSCPVIDIYGLHETRPIAASVDGGPFRILDRRILVECIDPAGSPVPDGQRGELVVTVGENPLLPLVRYRTGDFGRLTTVDGAPAIADLEGREDVVFTAPDGSPVATVDLTQQLQAAGARAWTLLQRRDGSVQLRIVGGDAARIEQRVSHLLGPTTVEPCSRIEDLGEGKPRRYEREHG
jgi:phenylacetate-CoA ligase